MYWPWLINGIQFRCSYVNNLGQTYYYAIFIVVIFSGIDTLMHIFAIYAVWFWCELKILTNELFEHIFIHIKASYSADFYLYYNRSWADNNISVLCNWNNCWYIGEYFIFISNLLEYFARVLESMHRLINFCCCIYDIRSTIEFTRN